MIFRTKEQPRHIVLIKALLLGHSRIKISEIPAIGLVAIEDSQRQGGAAMLSGSIFLRQSILDIQIDGCDSEVEAVCAEKGK